MHLPQTNTLLPQSQAMPDGSTVSVFPNTSTELLKIDLLFEAGSAYQSQLLCASAAAKMITIASSSLDSAKLAEFMDYRGVVLDSNCDILQNTFSVYMLRRFADQVVPVIASMLRQPAFSDQDFQVWQRRREAEIAALEQQTKHLARRDFYLSLFGPDHPLGRYATSSDVMRLKPDTVREHLKRYYSAPNNIVLSGNVDDHIIELLQNEGIKVNSGNTSDRKIDSLFPTGLPCQSIHRIPLPDAVQTSLRVGRILPFTWEHPDYPAFMILTTLLGGYFGSRLMSNLREDKGYTYGIYAHTQIYRGVIVFFIVADVASGTADDSVEQIRLELNRLREEPVSDDELELVKKVFVGDFLRSIDGVFERSQRYCDMIGTYVDERLTDRLREALETCTPTDLQRLAKQLLNPDDMIVCLSGAF